MAILEGQSAATLKDVDATHTLALARLRALEAQQAEQFRQHRWNDAQGFTVAIAKARHWAEDLARHASSLTPAAASAPVSDLQRLDTLLIAELDLAVVAARERGTPDAFARADTAWRTLVAFQADAFVATGDAHFDQSNSPAFPLPRPARNPTTPREPVDRTRWRHLLLA